MPTAGPLTRPHGIEDEGTPLGHKPKLNFVGAGVEVSNVGNKTEVRIAGGGPEGAFELQDATDLTGTPGVGKGWVREAGGSMLWTDLATQAELDAHVNDASAAHAASAVSFTPNGSIAATDVQTAIQEVRDEAGVGGGTVDDQTIATSDNTVNNVTNLKHGWAPKFPNIRSHYLNGVGTYSLLYSLKEWFVDDTVLVGGDGHSPAGAFTTFAAANTAAQPRDIIYVCSDLHEDITISKQDLTVVGVGKRVLYGSGSTSIGARTVNVTAIHVRFENFLIWGNSGFKGVHLCLNLNAGFFYVKDVHIDGTGGAAFGTSTFYPTSPGTGTKTGIGGVGILCHHAENGYAERIKIKNCSIGIGLGTWSTQNLFNRIESSGNNQDLVLGMYTGPQAQAATTGAPFGYSLYLLAAPGDDHAGVCTFINWQPVSPAGVGSGTTPPSIDLVGDTTGTNFDADTGAANTFINVGAIEGGTGQTVRIGTRGNMFFGCADSTSNTWKIAGTHNRFSNFRCQGSFTYTSDSNTFEDFVFLNPSPQSGWMNGSGSQNTFRNIDFTSVTTVPLSHTGTGNMFYKCQVETGSGTVPTRAAFGTYPTIIWSEGSYAVPYGTTVGLAAHVPTGLLNVTNGTAFTITNPVDPTNGGDTSKILCTTPIHLIILNSSGGAMGAITWGSKLKLAGAFTNPANGKRRTISFFYDFPNDVWVETGRSAADIG